MSQLRSNANLSDCRFPISTKRSQDVGLDNFSRMCRFYGISISGSGSVAGNTFDFAPDFLRGYVTYVVE